MPKFRLVAQVTVTAYTEIEADTLDQAVKMSEGRPVEFAGGISGRDSSWIVEEPDGLPQDIEPDPDFPLPGATP